MLSKVSPRVLFPRKPTIVFYPEQDGCPHCGADLKVRKSRKKTVVTMDIGAFRAKEFIWQCPNDQTIFTSEKLRNLAPEKCTFGYDVIEAVGSALFLSGRNNREIMSSLAKKNLYISERAISFLGRKFVIYIALAHQESKEQLQQFMMRKGGYVLHVDGTCEGNSPHLFCGLDGISELVLDSIKIPSEKKELLIPFFQRIKKQYGEPAACVHDMGVGIVKAIEEVFPKTPDYICHFHFLRDIGLDLLSEDYKTIIRRLKKHKIRSLLRRKARYIENKTDGQSRAASDFATALENGEINIRDMESIPATAAYTLINWAFEAPSQSRGYGFPFDRPHYDFYRRLRELHSILKEIISIRLRGQSKDNKPLIKVYHILQEVMADQTLAKAAAGMKKKAMVFDKLRAAMRIAPIDGKKGLNDDGIETDLKTIEQEVTKFRDWLVSDKSRRETYSKMLEQIDKYWDKLFADPLVVNTAEGQMTLVPQRTNNILERFFRGEKRMGRRKSGTASLNKMLKSILAETPLVRNLEKEEYHNIILNGRSTLAERFAQIDAKLVREKLRQEPDREKIAPEIKKLIKQTDLPEKILTLFRSSSNIEANRHLRP